MKKQKKKIISLLMVVMLLVNLFSPYSILLSESQAASGTVPDPVVVFNKIQNIIEKNGNKYFKVQIAVVGDVNLNGIDVQFGFDQTKIEPANKVSGKPTTSIGMISEVYPDMADGSYATKTYTNGTFRIKYAKGGGHDLPALDYSAGAGWEDIYAGYDTWAADFDYYLPIITYTFRLVDTSLTDKDITADLFSLKPIPYSLPTGAQIVYFNEKGVDLAYDINSLVGTGFAKPDKTVESISITTNPTKTEYIHGENISLEGGVISVTYTDKTTENISMTDPGVSITSGTPADVNNPIVKVTYANKEASFAITVNDPIQSINVKTPMQKVEYQHGDNLDFSGLEIEATKKSGAKEILTQNTSGLTISEKIASVTSNNFTQTSPEGEIPAKGTQKIIFTYEGKTTYQTIVVNDTISNIELKTQPTKTVYKRGEDLDLSGSSIQINLGSGTSTIINLPDGNVVVSNYNPNTIGTKQHLTVKFGEKTATNTIDVEAYDYIVLSELTDPSKYRYNLNENLDVSDGSLKLVWHSGNITNENLSENMVTGFDNTKPGTQTLTITYKPVYTLSDGKQITDTITKTFEIEVVNAISSITITPPTKTTYNHGDNLDLTGGEIVVTYQDKTISNVKIAESTISESDGSPVNMRPASYDSTNKLNKVLKIKYTEDIVTKEAEYPITIVNDVRSIKMHTTPKTQYNVNDVIELTGGEILVTRAVGASEVVSLTDVKVKVTGFDSKTEHTDLPLTVTYTENDIEKTTTYNINVKDTVKSISIKTEPTKKNYKYNEPLEVAGGTITVTKGSGTEEIPLTDDMISGYDPTKLGDQTVTVTYGGQTTTFVVNVKDYVTKISVKPNTITGKYNDELSKLITDNSITYTVTYAKAGDKTPETLVESMVTGYNKTNINAQTLTVTYTDNDTESYTKGTEFTADLSITLENEVAKVEITKPTKDTYNHAEELNLEGGTITITYANGKTEQEPITSATITEENGDPVNMSPESYDDTNKLSKTLKITYTKDEKTGTVDYPITIINDVKEIKMHTTPKTQYNVNDVIELTGGEILVTRAVGASEVVSLTDVKVKVTGFDSKTEHTDLPLTVTYTENDIEKTTTYNINVKDTAKSISIKTEPTKKNYKYNEPLEVEGGIITVTKGSGTEEIPLTDDMISGYDPTKLGDQTVTVTYGGQTTTFVVNVKDYVTKISVKPNTITGKYNDELSKLITDNSITYTVTYAKAGDKTPETLVESMVTGYNKTDINAQTLTVTYTDNDTESYTKGTEFTADLTVTLENEVAKVEITKPTKDTYNHAEELNLEGGTITITYANGKTEQEPITSATITEENGDPVNMSPESYDDTNKLSKTLKITYTKDEKTGTVDYPITIINDVKSIAINTEPKKNYQVNDELDLTIGDIIVTRAVGTEIVSLNSNKVKVTGFDSKTEHKDLPLAVEFTENGITKQTSYNVNVTDNILSLAIQNTPKTQYKYGESLDVSTGTIKIEKSSGPKIIPITENMVTELDGKPFDGTKLGTRNLKVTYGGKTVTYEITVSDYVTGIILTPPTKQTYEYGESLNLDGGSVQKVMASGASTTPVELNDSQVTLSKFDPNKEGAQTIEVTYEGFTQSFGVIVEDNIKTISISKTPKTNYKYGENLDVTRGEILVTKTSGKTQNIPLTTSMVTGYEPNKLGNQELTVTYKNKQTKYTVNVKDYVKDIQIVKPTKLIYKIGESIDLRGGTVQTVMASGIATTPIAMSNQAVTIQGFDSSTEGAKEIKVTYEGFTKTFGITVVDELTGMVIVTLPNKLEYKYGENLDLTGGTVALVKQTGTQKPVNITKDMVTGYNPNKLGNQTLTITYEGFTQEFIVNVKDYISTLKVVAPNKTQYEYGEDIDLTGATVSIIMASGKVEEKTDMTASMISGFNSKQEGKQVITVKYKGLQGNFQVTVTDKVKGISMNTNPNKVEYEYGENLDITGATITVVKSSGITTIPVTQDMVSGYKPNTPGTQLITVTHEGFTTNFVVTVAEKEPEKPIDPEKPQEPQEPQNPEKPTDKPTDNKPNNNNDKPIENKPNNKPTNNNTTNNQNNSTNNNINTNDSNDNEENTSNNQNNNEQEQSENQKPTGTLGVKDEQKDTTIYGKVAAGVISTLGIIFLLILIFFRRNNVKIYVEENGEFVLGGTDRLTKKKLQLDINKYLDGDTYPNKVKIYLKDSISQKLDGKEIEIKHRENTIKHKIKYDNKPYEINLK